MNRVLSLSSLAMCHPEILGLILQDSLHTPMLILCLGASILQAIIPWLSIEPLKAHVTPWSNYWKAVGPSRF